MALNYLKHFGFAALFLTAVALVAAASWQTASATARALADHGVTTTAFVVQKQRDTQADDPAQVHYQVTYAYQSQDADGTRTTHRVMHGVPEGIFDSVRVGERVEVRYLPENPAQADVYPGETSDRQTFLDILAVVAALAAGVAALAGPRLAHRPERMAQPA